MSIKETIISMKNNTREVYESIGALGGELPDDKNLENLAMSMDEIPVLMNWYEPDLSKPLDKDGYDNLQKIVAAGKASEYVKLGDTIQVPFNSWIMPYEVVGFEDIVVLSDGIEKTSYAIQLLAKYTSDDNLRWMDTGPVDYASSYVRSNLNNTYLRKLDTNFVACLGYTKVNVYNRDGLTGVVYDRIFAPSMTELGVTNTTYNTAAQNSIEGPTFSRYAGSTDAMRIRAKVNNITGGGTVYWTRSCVMSNSQAYGVIMPTGYPYTALYNNASNCYLVGACNFVGKE